MIVKRTTLPLKSSGWGERSCEFLLSVGNSVCLGTNLPSEPLPPGLAGLEQRDVVGPGLLPATEKEEETERVGLCLISTQKLVRHRGADRLQPDRGGVTATGEAGGCSWRAAVFNSLRG